MWYKAHPLLLKSVNMIMITINQMFPDCLPSDIIDNAFFRVSDPSSCDLMKVVGVVFQGIMQHCLGNYDIY